MQPHRSIPSQWNFVADAPRFYDWTKTEEENNHMGHAWFDQSKLPSTFVPTILNMNEPTVEEETEVSTSTDLQDNGATLEYDNQSVNYTADVYFNSPSHRRQITKRRDIKTELSRTRHEQTQHLQGDNTMEYTALEDGLNENSVPNDTLAPSPPPQPKSLVPPSNAEENQNDSIILGEVGYSLVDDEEQQEQHQQQLEDEDGYRLIKLPLLGRVIISPKATSNVSEPSDSPPRSDVEHRSNPSEAAAILQTGPDLSPVLGTQLQINWAMEQQSSVVEQSGELEQIYTTRETVENDSTLDESQHKVQYSTQRQTSSSPSKQDLNHNERTQRSQQPSIDTLSHELSLSRKRIHSGELYDDLHQQTPKKRSSPSKVDHDHTNTKISAPEDENQQQFLPPLLQLLARIKAQRRPPPSHQSQKPLSPLLQLIARVKSYKRQHRSISRPLSTNTGLHRSVSWKTETTMERAKRVMKETRVISLQWNLPSHQQHQNHYHFHTNQRRITTTGLHSALENNDRQLLDPMEEERDDDDNDTTEEVEDKKTDNEQHQHRSNSVVHSFISPYLPVALTVPRSPKFSAEKRSRRW
ncbi:hypothetical protein BCR42DRAFT_428362 [Absidia repens]|uniref:Uncharacterized protein n=1 Tax=Absidia repens TaxID=90262 RepID=A0A1X2HYZ6_9FUNG|nr:hypothetical protein BCR42DRAFT_428362 [Absidia repens]